MNLIKKNWDWVLLFLLTIPVVYQLIRPGFFPMQDDLQAFRIHQMHECIKDLQIPCRWVPDAGFQYGYPQFNFYPPSVYYLGEVFHLLGLQFVDAVKLLFILGYILLTVVMYVFLRSLLPKIPAFFGTTLYIYMPYKAVEVYVRGAMSEFWAQVFFPLAFWSSLQLIKTGQRKYLLWLSLSVGLLLLTHNLMTVIFIPLLVVWSLFWIISERKYQAIKSLMLSALLGFGLAAFFSLPVLFEGKFVHLETLVGGYFDYRQHFVDLNQLFLSNTWGYGSSFLGPNDELSLSTGPIQSVIAAIGIILALLTFKKNRRFSILYLVLTALTLAVLFMIHERSSFIWSLIPPLRFLQFPWRILSDSIFLLSLLCGLAIYFIKRPKLQILTGVILVILTIYLHGSFFKPREWYNINDAQKFSGNLWEKQLTISIFDYLPIYATLPPPSKAPTQPEILEGEANVLSYGKRSDFQQGRIEVKKTSVIRAPLYDFPGMKVLANNKEVSHWNDDCRQQKYCLGLITFKLEPGEYDLQIKLTDTPIRILGNLISLVSWGILFCLIFNKNFKLRIKNS